MKIPDKIYIPVVKGERCSLISTIWWDKDNRDDKDKEYIPYIIPYIREDTRWKPTAEQVECLRRVMYEVKRKHEYSEFDILRSLFQELVKQL